MNTFNVQKLLDGPRNAIFKVDVALDGASGDYVNPVIVIDPALLSIPGPGNATLKRLRVDQIDWDVQNGLSVSLFWDGVGSAPLWRMVGRSIEKARSHGGLQSNAEQPTGRITMTTTTTAPGVPLFATFKIHCVKKP